VSGRVVDDRGRPVANAEVRLVDGSSTAGRVVRTLTDDAGSFTLRLRPGQQYTLVAYGDRNGKELEGRETVEAPESRVEIALRDAAEVRTVSRAPTTRRVADRADFEQDTAGVNEDDLPAPASRREMSDETSTSTRGADPWHSAGAGKPAASGEPPLSTTDPMPSAFDPNRASTVDSESTNPLPPALERRDDANQPIEGSTRDLDASRTKSSDANAEPFTAGEGPLTSGFESGATTTSSQPPATPSQPLATQPPDSGPIPIRGEETKSSNEQPAPGTEPAVQPSAPTLDFPATPAPAGSMSENVSMPLQEPAKPESSTAAPASNDVKDADQNQPASDLAQPVAAPSRFENEPPDESPTDGSPSQAAKSGSRRPTWRELTAQSEKKAPPADPSISVRRGPTPDERKELATQTAPRRKQNVVQSTCRYDARTRRIVDFQLASLDGSPVHFAEIDADYVLLDFWGTWCGPCLKSIPHLVDLQGRYDPKRVRVVGIAYETGSPESRADVVRRTAEQLGVNYPLLLAETDGKDCPLAAALHVQAYPTMILVDRHGRVLWRDSGSSDAMLSRLDRVVAANARGGDTVVR
jgi:thiol-disulfide isomerase/thioredoxin